MMRYAFLLGFWRVHGLSTRDLEVLTGPMDSMASDWDAKKVPMSRRGVTFLLSDVRAAADPFLLAPEPENGLVETAGGWIKRNLIGADPAVQTPTELGRAFADSTALVRWTHDGFSGASEEAMSREIEKAILKAHDAGAEINIVAQGVDAAPVLAALKRLEGVERGGVKVGANKVMLLGMDKARLKRIPSVSAYDFSRPGNVLEIANVWVPREEFVRTMKMQAFGGNRNGETFAMEAVWPGLAEGGDSIERSLRLLRNAVETAKSLDQVIGQQEQALKDAEAARRAQEQALIDAEAARKAAEEAARRKAAAEDAARRAAVAKKAGIIWVSIPGGSFMMGSDAGESNERPVHRVTVKSFEMAKTEVTNNGYRACVKAGVCTPAHVSDGTCYLPKDDGTQQRGNLPLSLQGANQPVVCVDWEQARAFSEWVGGRLPTEAEWEYAARSAGKDWKYPWGDEADAKCDRAVTWSDVLRKYGCGRNAAWPVCSKSAGNTAQGLCDMAGNVSEWTQDWHHDSYQGAPDDGSAWESPAGSRRVHRGGSCHNVAANVRAARRNHDVPAISGTDIGLRPVLRGQ